MKGSALSGTVAASALLSGGTAEPWRLRSTLVGTGLVLSNNGRTVTNVSAGDNNLVGVWTDRSISQNMPPVYWEVRCEARGAGANIGAQGITYDLKEADYNSATLALFEGTAFMSVGYREDGSIFQNGTTAVGFGASAGRAYVAGDVIMFAFNPVTRALFFGRNGTWLNSNSPTPGERAPFYLGPAAFYKPFLHARDLGDSYTIRSTQAEFTYSPPPGFLPLAEVMSLPRQYIPLPIVNPGCETGTSGWTVVSGTLGTLSPANMHTPTFVFTAGTNCVMEQVVQIPAAFYDDIDNLRGTMVPSLTHSAGTTGTTNRIRVEIVFRNAAGGTISTAVGTDTASVAQSNVPLRLVEYFNIPAGTRSIVYRVRVTRTSSTFYFDNMSLGLYVYPGLSVEKANVHAVLGAPQNNVAVRKATLHVIIIP